MGKLWNISKSQVSTSNFSSSELKSVKTINTLEKVPMEDMANSGKNDPTDDGLDFRFDMVDPPFSKLRSC